MLDERSCFWECVLPSLALVLFAFSVGCAGVAKTAPAPAGPSAAVLQAPAAVAPTRAPTSAPSASAPALIDRPTNEPALSGPSPAEVDRELTRRLSERFPGVQGYGVTVDTGMHQTDVVAAATDAAETFVVTVSADKTARVWATADGKPSAVLRPPALGRVGPLFGVAVTPKGDRVALAGASGEIYLFDRASWGLVKVISPQKGPIFALAFSPDGKRLAVGFYGRAGLLVYETTGYTALFAASDFGADIYGLAFSRSGQLAVTSWDKTVRLYSAKHELLATQVFPTRPYRVAFDPSGKRIVVGFIDAAVARVLSVPTLATERELSPTAPTPTSLGAVAFAKDGSRIFAAGRFRIDGRNAILRWKADFTPLEPWFLNQNTPEGLRGLKGGKLLLVAQDPLVALVGSAGTAQWAHTNGSPDFGPNPQQSFRASADASLVAFDWGRGESTRIVFDVRGPGVLTTDKHPALLSPTTELPGITPQNWRNSMDPSLRGQRLDVDRFEVCRALSFAKNGRFLLGCEWNLYLFESSGRRLWRRRTEGSARAVYLTDDARTAVVAFDDGSIRWFDGSAGEEQVGLVLNGEQHDWVAFTPAGFYTGTPSGERLLGLSLMHQDRSIELVQAAEYADLLRRPDIVGRAITAGADSPRHVASL